MYEELINSLRYCATHSCMGEAPALTGCTAIYDDAPKDCDSCNAVLQWQAADAIEELETACDQYEKNYKNLCEYLPKWIPVTERLPKTRESILGKKSSKVIVAFRFDDGTQGTDTAHTLNGEWVFEDHITVVARTITHWRPLPAPPALDTDKQP